MAGSGSAVFGLMHFTPFFEFAIVVVVVGSLIVLAAAVWSANRVR